MFTHQLNIARWKFYSDKIKECRGDQRKLFSLINSVSKPKKKVDYPPARSITELANDFSNFFVTKIKLIREELDSIETDAKTSDYWSSYKPIKQSSNFEILSKQQVRELISKPPIKQCIADPLPTWIVKEWLDEQGRVIISIDDNVCLLSQETQWNCLFSVTWLYINNHISREAEEMLTMNVFPISYKVQVDFADINTKLGNSGKNGPTKIFIVALRKLQLSCKIITIWKFPIPQPSLYGPMA